MRVLRRKLLRELWETRWQAVAIVLVMASGVAMVVMSVSTLQSLERTRARFYVESRFADVFAQLRRAPLELVRRARELPGIATAEARIVWGATLDVPGLAEPATCRLVSLPDRRPPSLNRLHLFSGRLLDPDGRGEALVSQAFAQAHRLRPGDRLRAVIRGRRQDLRIVGVVLSPEYIYSVRPGELLPDDKRFGVLWMRYDELAPAVDLDGAFNDLSVSLLKGASQAAVLHDLDRLLAPYGGTNAYGRDQQPSHKFLDNEMLQLRTMALVPPAIFLAVTGFLLNVVMSRMVAMQREQIAAMRAFGYRRVEVARHFLEFALAICVVGAAAGVLFGAELGRDLTGMYSAFFRFPRFDYELDGRLALAASSIAVAAAFVGVIGAVWRAASEPPATAMQPAAPPRYRRSLAERLLVSRWLPQVGRMVLRQLERRPLRAALATIGIALSISLLVMGSFLEDTVDHVMEFQFFQAQRYDMMVGFAEPLSGDAVRELSHYEGVLRAEPFRAAPVRLAHRHHERRLELMGLADDARLMRVVSPRRGPVTLPTEGVVLSSWLANLLDCRPGDRIEVELLEGRRGRHELLVAGVVDDYLGLNAYLRLELLWRLLDEQDSVSGAFLAADAARVGGLYEQLKATPGVGGASVKRAAIDSYRKTMAENLLRMRFFNVLFASVVSFGVVYNCARISLAERSRELATLRVLGFTRGEASTVLLGELGVLVALAIPVGLALGRGLAQVLTISLHTEVHRFPVIISPRTDAFAVMVTVVSALVSALVVRRRVDHLDLVSVLKTRD